ncbi:hypothetical protein [Pseudomonas koreensis]|uniref:Uncharacterized protein n=1 Tax=Pseudomonas koreensis TaxID=198620 RepID=A0AA94EML4_9PSED|nr:hypothetical protein [Pseudomonas koreensis]RVD77017.1 hypothetical protein A9HBioS_3040 [Pseudomonas koreensis]
MSAITVTVSIKLAWWVPAYIAGVRFMSELTGLEPDIDRVQAWIMRGINFQVFDNKR